MNKPSIGSFYKQNDLCYIFLRSDSHERTNRHYKYSSGKQYDPIRDGERKNKGGIGKEMTAVQAAQSRKRDRFEYSGEASNAVGSANAPKADKASNGEQNAAKANDDPRSYDRVEFTYAKASDGEKASDISAEKMSDSNDNSSSQSVSADDSSESVDTNKLYQYTDTELKEFLLDGSITQSEYDAEIAKREY